MKRLALVISLLAACGGGKTAAPSEPAPSTEPPAAGSDGNGKTGAGCITTGCSGTVCTEAGGDDMMTTCEFKPEYACYRDAECRMQDSGKCGWTQSDALTACLASPPPV